MAERDSGNSWDSLWVDLGLEAPRGASVPKLKPAPAAPPAPTPEPVAEAVPVPSAPVPVERPRPVYLTSDEATDIHVTTVPVPVPVPVPVSAAVEASDEDDEDEMIENNPDGTPGKKRRRRRRRGRKGGREDGSDLETPVAVAAPEMSAPVAETAQLPPALALEASIPDLETEDDGETETEDDGDDDGEELEAGVDMVLSEAEEIETFEAADQPSAMDEELDNEDSTPEKKEWSVVSWSELVAGLNR